MKLDANKHAQLIAAWLEYGHAVNWRVLDAKFAPHGYVALSWPISDDEVEYADLSLVDGRWEMQNDTAGPISSRDWRCAKIPAGCDWLSVNGRII